jgi:hypothetical protein
MKLNIRTVSLPIVRQSVPNSQADDPGFVVSESHFKQKSTNQLPNLLICREWLL